jgi:hypothetical protein
MPPMKMRVVKRLNPFQLMVTATVHELWRRGYDSYGATDERIERIICTTPHIRELLDAQGHEWSWEPSERLRVCEVVRHNITARERRIYTYNNLIDIEGARCGHGAYLYCPECWKAGQDLPPGHRPRRQG